ncbi:MAG: HypC/HybG/HupF family hydrogenase formation chaperone [Candidatus Altiarchaeota archaeon]
MRSPRGGLGGVEDKDMCYAIPAKIIGLTGEIATVDYGGLRKKTNVSMIDSPKRGDYVLVHAGFAIEKLAPKDAEESLSLIREYAELARAEDANDG